MCVCILLTVGRHGFSLVCFFFFTFSSPNKSCPLNKDGNMEKRVMFVLRWRGGGSLPWGSLGREAPGLREQPGRPPCPPHPSRRAEVPPYFDHGR